jgi:membrane protease subunit HflC
MNSGRFGLFILLGLIVVVAGLSLFTVNERELAIKLRVGEVVQANYEPGLHWKIPVIENVRKFPDRILTISDRPERIFTAENEALEVDFFVKYRIVDSVRFYTSTGAVREVAEDGKSNNGEFVLHSNFPSSSSGFSSIRIVIP